MAILVKSSTADDSKDYWSTTWQCFYDAQKLHGRPFKTDVAAEPLTAKCKRYFTGLEFLDGLLSGHGVALKKSHLAIAVERGLALVGFDAMLADWGDDYWCNPPFSHKLKFIKRARVMQAKGYAGMMLLPYEPLTDWWQDNLSEGCIIYEPKGRYQFYERDGETEKSGANFGSALVSFPVQKIGESIRIRFNRGIGGYVKPKKPRSNKISQKQVDIAVA